MVKFLLYGDKESCDTLRYEFTLKHMNKEKEETIKVLFLFLSIIENNKKTIDSDAVCGYLGLTAEKMMKVLDNLQKLGMISAQFDNNKNFEIIINGYKKPGSEMEERKKVSFDEELFKKEEKLNEIFFISEGILRRVLTDVEMERIQYLFEELSMSPVQIIELIGYVKNKYNGELKNLINIATKWKEKEYKPLNEVFGFVKQAKKKSPQIMQQDYGDMDELEKELLERSYGKLRED